MSFLEMPGTFTEDSSAEADVTPGEDGNQAERFTAIRVRDVKTGRFVAAPTLVAKKLSMPKGVTRIAEASTAGIIGGVIANQAPQNNRSWKTNKKRLKEHLDDDMSVKLVKKSFVPGQGYVKASKLGAAGLRDAARGRKLEAQNHPTSFKYAQKQKDDEYRDWVKDVREHIDEVKSGQAMMSGPRRSVMYAPSETNINVGGDSGVMAYALHVGGRRGERIMVVPHGTESGTVRHEMAHLNPKRSSFRLATIMEDPAKLMREEARADMASRVPGDYYKSSPADRAKSKSGYTQAATDPRAANIQRVNNMFNERAFRQWGDEGLNAYRETQDQIYNARQARKLPRQTPKFRGNQFVDDKGQKRQGRNWKLIGVGAGGTGAAGGGGYYAFQRHQKKKS